MSVWDFEPTVRSTVGTLERALVHEPGPEFETVVDPDSWNWEGIPRRKRAAAEHATLVEALEDNGVTVDYLGAAGERLAESLFVNDVGFVLEGGVVISNMVEETRHGEERWLLERVVELGIPVYHMIHGPGRLEAGNVLWLDESTIAVGRSRTTNVEGIRQLRQLTETHGIELVEVPIFGSTESSGQTHLALVFGMVDVDLAVLYPPAIPPTFRELLADRGIETIEVPMREQRNRATSIVALEPGTVLLPAGNQVTRRALADRGVDVIELDIREIQKTGGGLYGLVLPLERHPL